MCILKIIVGQGMMQAPPDIDTWCKQYHDGEDDRREEMFAGLYTSHYHGPDTAPEELARLLTQLVLALDVLPKKSDVDTLQIIVFMELFWGMQLFCVATPTGIDFAWNATDAFIKGFKGVEVAKGEFDVYEFAVDQLKYWTSEFCSDIRCYMQGVTSASDVRDGDSSVLSIKQNDWNGDATEQLANLARNRKERRHCVVNKVLAARALRDGYVYPGPGGSLFQGARELRDIEFPLQRTGERGVDDGYQSGCDVIAAMFQLRACARTLLDVLPKEGCVFPERYRIEPLGPGETGRSDRLSAWKQALSEFIVGEKAGRSDFAVMAYAGLALENLREPRDESSVELFSFDNLVI